MRTTRAFAPLRNIECRDSGAESGAYTFKGHAAVFNRPCDFRYFTEYIAPGAFSKALAVKPLEVVSNWQHDDRWILGHTLNKTLELVEDDEGLMQWTRPAPTAYAADLRILLERGDIQQASFCFTINAEEWVYENEGQDDERITVTITDVGCLYDVTACALGAYPQTDVAVAARSRLDIALRQGRVSGLTLEDARERGIFTGDPDLAAERGGEDIATAHDAGAERLREMAKRRMDDAREQQQRQEEQDDAAMRVLAQARAYTQHARATAPEVMQ